MHGIIVKRLGHNVHILEQYPSSARESQAAGMSTGSHCEKFLANHDRAHDVPHSVATSILRIYDADLNVTKEYKIPLKLTTWKTLYYRLRANFDGLSSEYIPSPPNTLPTDGSAKYDIGKRVTDISHRKDSGLTISFEDIENGICTSLHPDLVIAADGANSTVRRILFPKLEAPYSGYLTWRGVVPETSISKETMDFLRDKAIRYRLDGSYVVVYAFPPVTVLVVFARSMT